MYLLCNKTTKYNIKNIIPSVMQTKVIMIMSEDSLFITSLCVVLGPRLDKLMTQMRSDLQANPPLVGSFKPSKGSLCIAKFSDDLWYDLLFLC